MRLSKLTLIKKLSSIANDDNKLTFATIDITPEEIQLRGTTKSAAAVLADLSKMQGFTQVEFYTPPVTVEGVGERFHISLRYVQQEYLSTNNELPS